MSDATSDEAARAAPEPEGMAVLRMLWQRRVLILLVALVFGAAGATYSLLATPIYRAQVTLLPVTNRAGQGLAGQLGGLAGLAGLAGINLEGPDKTEPLAVLSSRDFARSFIEEQALLTVLLADKWDEKAGKWKNPGPKQPDIRDAVERFDKKVRRVGEDRKSGLVVLTIDWEDPELAARWANILAGKINTQMRARAIDSAERSIKYLRAELAVTNEVPLQLSISRLLESQMQTIMVARGNDEYSFRVVDQARVPKKRLHPKRTMITLGTFLIGGLLTCVWLMLSGKRPAAPQRR
jgi:uncharacterized protein involved in exopolysaccharide biosynthesis